MKPLPNKDGWIDLGDYSDACVWIDVSTSLPPPRVRTPRRDRRALAYSIREAVLAISDWQTVSVGEGVAFEATVGDLSIRRTSAASLLRGMPATNGIDIALQRKVFSMWWPDGDVDPDDFEIVAMASGDWFAPLLEPR